MTIDFAKGNGLVPVVVQDWRSRAVLMVGYANEEAVALTQATGRLYLWSRSRQELWLKGEKSGNYLLVRRLSMDCDGDTLLAEVEPATGDTHVCHTGAETCFFTELSADSAFPVSTSHEASHHPSSPAASPAPEASPRTDCPTQTYEGQNRTPAPRVWNRRP